jgi:putative hydrolase of the HAD superfamily
MPINTERRLSGPAVRLRRARLHAAHANEGRKLWLFDLDNTLHDTSFRIFPYISEGMTRAVMTCLGVDEAEAQHLRAKYWRRYGATMIGMVKHHGISADEFLWHSHNFDVRPLVRSESAMHHKLGRLPGRKVLVTNAPLNYARAVLKHMGVLQHFHGLWGIEHLKLHGQYKPKPSPAILRHIVACEGVAAHRAVLVEDTLSNLRGARAAGLKTVHVFHPSTPFAHQRRGRPHYVDLRVNHVSDLLLMKRPLRG